MLSEKKRDFFFRFCNLTKMRYNIIAPTERKEKKYFKGNVILAKDIQI